MLRNSINLCWPCFFVVVAVVSSFYLQIEMGREVLTRQLTKF
jgi:hypothetical protein